MYVKADLCSYSSWGWFTAFGHHHFSRWFARVRPTSLALALPLEHVSQHARPLTRGDQSTLAFPTLDDAGNVSQVIWRTNILFAFFIYCRMFRAWWEEGRVGSLRDAFQFSLVSSTCWRSSARSGALLLLRQAFRQTLSFAFHFQSKRATLVVFYRGTGKRNRRRETAFAFGPLQPQ